MRGEEPGVAVIGRTSPSPVYTLVGYQDAHHSILHQKPEWKTLNYHLHAADQIVH